MYELFPSPHSGILFLSYPRWDLSQIYKDSFRPLIRGFFFYVGNVPSLVMAHQRVSVPSFGDSFFMVKKNESNDRRKRRFPSPHSGILFLYIMKISSIIGKLFPSPHSGILFLSVQA